MASKRRKTVVLSTTTSATLGSLSEWGKVIVVKDDGSKKSLSDKE